MGIARGKVISVMANLILKKGYAKNRTLKEYLDIIDQHYVNERGHVIINKEELYAVEDISAYVDLAIVFLMRKGLVKITDVKTGKTYNRLTPSESISDFENYLIRLTEQGRKYKEQVTCPTVEL